MFKKNSKLFNSKQNLFVTLSKETLFKHKYFCHSIFEMYQIYKFLFSILYFPLFTLPLLTRHLWTKPGWNWKSTVWWCSNWNWQLNVFLYLYFIFSPPKRALKNLHKYRNRCNRNLDIWASTNNRIPRKWITILTKWKYELC